MTKLIGSMIAIALLSGCIVHTHSRNRNGTSARRSTACPPSQHWNGYQCVHNGRARGHDKHR